ncbi:MAG: hypothetical protein IIA61_01220 [Candidatus Marinimicrobia bacterium]|nr:hypothetical protein [Candidatus Neomarinimicrobiota bacterium]
MCVFVQTLCRNTQFPIISNFPCGHGVHQMTIPYDTMARILCTKDRFSFTLLESAVV